MMILFITLCLRAPWCGSLKDKRSVVKALVSGIRGRFNVSVAESDHQDIHHLIGLSIAALAANKAQGDSLAEQMYRFIQSVTDADLYEWLVEWGCNKST
jgi:uncharacterized protein YlxP (DUF503 family)